jgi:hypothetical protein
MGRGAVGFCDGLGEFVVLEAARRRGYADLFLVRLVLWLFYLLVPCAYQRHMRDGKTSGCQFGLRRVVPLRFM